MWYDVMTGETIDVLSIDERVVAYGDGFFTTMAVVTGQINWLSYHVARIIKSCHALQLAVDLPAVTAMLERQASQLGQGILKLIVCRKRQPNRGYGFTTQECHAWLNVATTPQPFAETANQLYYQPPANVVCLTQQIACLPQPLAGLKLLNAQDKVLAATALIGYQAKLPNVFDGLVQDVMGRWVEGTFCNLIYQLPDGQWYTPPLAQSGVAGVMRQVMMDQCTLQGTPITERILHDRDFADICSMVLCNAVRGIIPIRRLYTQPTRYRALVLACPVSGSLHTPNAIVTQA